MPRAPKPCGTLGCPRTVVARNYCDTCKAQQQQHMAQRRGTTAQRGYGGQHQAERKRLTPVVASGLATCWRCEGRIRPGQPWDVGHDDRDRSVTRGPEHARRADCPAGGNRATSGRTPPGGPLPRSPQP